LLAYHGNEFLRSRHGETQAGQEQRRTKEELKGAASKGRGGGVHCHSNEGNGRHSGNVARAGKSDQGDDDGVKGPKATQKNKNAVFFFFLVLKVSCTWTLASTHSRPLSLLSYWFINLKFALFFFLFLAFVHQVVSMFFSLFL